jgi:probable rRNA maturation factor
LGRIRIEIVNEQGVMDVDERSLRRTAKFVCKERKVADADISIAVVNDAAIRLLKKRYFGRAVTTDVISFNLGGESKRRRPDKSLEAEIVINAQQAVRTAKRMSADPVQELHLYLIHGLLHMMGFDDQTAKAAQKMHRMEGLCLRGLGFDKVTAP